MAGVIRLTNERAWRTYLGGCKIDELHGIPSQGDNHFPEEWIMSITACRNAGREHIVDEGMSKEVASGKHLAEFIEETPEALLGKQHYESFGSTTGVLIKIIDSAERLSIQVHPNKEMAKTLFGSEYGKTESWHILGGREVDGEVPCIYLGFKKGVTKEQWKDVFERQDIPEMLDCLHKIEVQPGETYLIKGGVPHAIGAGCFLLEVQEPTDYTIRTERTTVSGFQIADSMCHQGIGFEKMFECFTYEGMEREEILAKYKLSARKDGAEETLIDYNDTTCFSLKKLYIDKAHTIEAENTFYGIYVLHGKGTLISEGKPEHIEVGNQFFVPAGTRVVLETEEPMAIAQFFGPQCKL